MMKNALEKYYAETIISFDNEVTAKSIAKWSNDIRIPFDQILNHAGVKTTVYLSNLKKEVPIRWRPNYSLYLDAIISEEKVKIELVFGGPHMDSSFSIVTDREIRKFTISPVGTSEDPFLSMEIMKIKDKKVVIIVITHWWFSLDIDYHSILIMATIEPLYWRNDTPSLIERSVEDIVDEDCYFGLRDIKRIENFVENLLKEKNGKNEILELIKKDLENKEELDEIEVYYQ